MGYSGKVKSKHSPEGEKYRKLGEAEYRRRHGKKLKQQRLQKRIDALNNMSPEERKEKGTYMGGSSTSSEPLSSKEWHEKYRNGHVSQSSLRSYRGYLRGFRGK